MSSSPPSRLMPSGLAKAILAQQVAPPPGHQLGGPMQTKAAWPASTGAAPPGMAGEPGAFHQPGGDLLNKMLHQAATPVDQFSNVLPEEGWFSPNVSPSRPVQVDLGSYTVPKGQNFWLFDYQFQVFVQSGVDAGDVKPADPGRFFGVMGFDLTYNGTRLASLKYEIDPHPPTFAKSGFQGSSSFGPPPTAFSLAAANSFAAAGPGLSLLPVWDKLMGPRQGPFSVQVQEGCLISLSAFIFRPIPAPITSISGRVAGFLLGANVSNALVNRMRPR